MSTSDASIHPDTTVGAVALTISNLDRAVQFYQVLLGLQLHKREGQAATLGASGSLKTSGRHDIVILHENPSARPAQYRTGLYHLAVLVPSRLELARSLRRLLEGGWPLQGFADHGVSEAVYLSDPDGNGIEIYRDRPRSEWPSRNGQLQMVSDPLDIEAVLAVISEAAELNNQDRLPESIPPGTAIGHVHLKVADIRAAETFYSGVLGFALMQRYGSSASFVSAGGYHHHIGFNTWESAGAPPPQPDSVGLRYFTIHLPGAGELERVLERVRAANLPVETADGGYLVRDPSQNVILLSAQEP